MIALDLTPVETDDTMWVSVVETSSCYGQFVNSLRRPRSTRRNS